MKKLLKPHLLLLLLLLVCIMCAACGGNTTTPPSAPAQPAAPAPTEASAGEQQPVSLTPRNFKLAHEESPSGPQHVYATKFAEYLEELSGGAYTCSVYTVGQLGDTVSCVEQCQTGALDIAFNGSGTFGVLVNYYNVTCLNHVFPSDIKDVEHFINNSTGMNMLTDIARDYNLQMLDWIHEGGNYWSANKAIHNPKDFEGVKFRVVSNPIMMGTFKAYGASPTPVPYTETYSALQLKMVDGETNPLASIVDMKFYEVQKYLINPKADYLTYGMAMNTGIWDSLPPEGQAVIREAIEKARADYYDYFYDYEDSLVGFLEGEGLTFVELNDEEIAVFRDLSKSVHQVFIDSCPDKERATALLNQIVEDCEAYL